MIGLTLAIYLFLCLHFWNYTVDDSFISYRYAENLTEGRGLVFNRGEKVEGYSNLLWVLLLSVFSFLKWDLLASSKILGLVSGGILIAGIGFLIKQERMEKQIAILVGMASSLLFIVWSITGMETVFYTLLVSLGLLSLCQENSKLQTTGSLFLGLAAVTRPEGIVFSFLGIVWICFQYKKKNQKPWFNVLLLITPFLLQLIFRKFYYGTWLTNTFHAKMGSSSDIWIKGTQYCWDFIKSWGPAGVVWLLIPVGFWGVWKKEKLKACILFAALIAQLLFIIVAGGDWMKPFRFWVPVLPLVYFVLVEGFEYLGKKYKILSTRSGWIIICVLLVIGNFWSWQQVSNYTSIYSEGLERTSIALGKWLKDKSSPDDWIALGDVGALPYYSGLQVIDLYGLVNPSIARLPGPALYSEGIETAKILDRKPRYISLESRKEELFEGLKKIDHKIYLEPRFRSEYRVIQKARFSPKEITWLFERREGENQNG